MITVCVTDQGARPDSGADAAPALRRSIAACRDARATVLRLPPGRYDIHHPEAVELMRRVLAGTYSQDLERALFHPNHRYPVGVDASGLRDLRIEAAGAILVCHGFMEALCLTGCRNLEVAGLTIDYARRPYTLGEVLHCAQDHFAVRLDAGHALTGGETSVARCLIYDPRSRRLLPDRQPGGQHDLLEGGILRVHRPPLADLTGLRAAVVHTLHFRPAILLRESHCVQLSDVDIHAQPGMGIVGHRCSDIVLRRLRVVPSPGCFISTNTDATHFTSCRGELRYESCQFAGHGDDAINVHGYYASIVEQAGTSCTITVDAPTGTHAQVLDHPEPGDQLELIDHRSLATVGHRQVREVHNDAAAWRSRLELDAALPEQGKGLLLANASAQPRLLVRDCHFSDHVARAVLVKTRGVRIEGCTFDHCGSTAIHLAPEAWWRESGGTADVVIRRNRMLNCGRAANVKGGGACAIAVEVDAEDREGTEVHRRLHIEDNLIVGDGAERGICVEGASAVTIRGNRIAGCRQAVHVAHCAGVSLDDG